LNCPVRKGKGVMIRNVAPEFQAADVIFARVRWRWREFAQVLGRSGGEPVVVVEDSRASRRSICPSKPTLDVDGEPLQWAEATVTGGATLGP